jgi:hypothetical protein
LKLLIPAQGIVLAGFEGEQFFGDQGIEDNFAVQILVAFAIGRTDGIFSPADELFPGNGAIADFRQDGF